MWILSRHQNKLIPSGNPPSQLELLVLERTESLQNLSQRLLRVQDEERRRVARDLHDSSGQTLTALKLAIGLLQKKLANDERISGELTGIALLADEALQEIRTTSYLLHPPMLDEAGFTSAARWYLEGFARRIGMKVRIEFAPEVERLPKPIETVLFRVLQESLTNVHRHSGASEVQVRFLREAHAVILEVRDYGRGIPLELLSRLGQSVRDSGVGLSGMCERLNELKGDLEITLADPGTRLRAIVPLSSKTVAHALPSRLIMPAARNGTVCQPCGTFMARAGKLPGTYEFSFGSVKSSKAHSGECGPMGNGYGRSCSAGHSLLDWLHGSPPPVSLCFRATGIKCPPAAVTLRTCAGTRCG